MAAAAATILASCAKEDNLNNESGEAARVGLSFTLPSAVTRAENVAGTGFENTITKITVFVFNATGDAVPGNGEVRAVSDFNVVSNTYTLKAGSEIETTAGARKIYIAANLPSGFTTPATETALLAQKVAMTAAVNGTTDLVMFSGKMDKPVTAMSIAGASATAQEIADNAAANKVTGSMERLVAKVVVTRAANTFDQTFAHAPSGFKVTYTVDNWGVGTGVSSVYAVKGTKTTGEYNAFNASAFDRTMPAVGDAKTTGNAAYVGENSPYSIGEMTYAMVRTRAVPNQVAKVNAGAIAWSAAGTLTDLYVVIGVDKKAYFCETSADADAVRALLGDGAQKYTYPGSYVYFKVFLNHTGSSKAGVIARNEFIHVNVTGVTADVFGGTPGVAPGGGTPTDPTDPNQPDPIDPNEPITAEEAYLSVEVTVSPWLYEKIDLSLE